jgi:hypothetical protein
MLLGKMKRTGLALPLGLFGGELEQAQGAFDVDPVGQLGGELAAGGEQRGEVEDGVNLVFGDEPAEQRLVEDVADHVDGAAGQLGRKRLEVEAEHMRILLAARASMSAWPISPALPVIITTRLRIALVSFSWR